MERLKGKVAVVTGAAAGIGREICLRLAREGATVVGMDRERAGAESVAEEVRAQGGVAHALAGDVSIGADCAQVTAEDCDLGLLLVDPYAGWGEDHSALHAKLVARECPVIVVATKADLKNRKNEGWPATNWRRRCED